MGPISLQISPSATRFKSISSPLQVQRPTGPVRGSGKGISSSNPLYVTPTPTLHCLLCEIPSCQLPPPTSSQSTFVMAYRGHLGGGRHIIRGKLSHPKGTHAQHVMVSKKSWFPSFPPMTPLPKPSGIRMPAPSSQRTPRTPFAAGGGEGPEMMLRGSTGSGRRLRSWLRSETEARRMEGLRTAHPPPCPSP